MLLYRRSRAHGHGRHHGDDYSPEFAGCPTVRSECSSLQPADDPLDPSDASYQRRSPRANNSIPMTTSHAIACYCVSPSAGSLGEVSTVCDCLGEASTCLQYRRISLTFFVVQSVLGSGNCALERWREEELSLRVVTVTIGVVLKRRPNPWRDPVFHVCMPSPPSRAVGVTRQSTLRYLDSRPVPLPSAHTMRSIQFQSRKRQAQTILRALRCHGATCECHTVSQTCVSIRRMIMLINPTPR